MNTMYYSTRNTRRRKRLALILGTATAAITAGAYWLIICAVFAQ